MTEGGRKGEREERMEGMEGWREGGRVLELLGKLHGHSALYDVIGSVHPDAVAMTVLHIYSGTQEKRSLRECRSEHSFMSHVHTSLIAHASRDG